MLDCNLFLDIQIKFMIQTLDTPPHKVHIGQKELKTVPREYQQRIHSLEQDVKLKEDIIIEREKSIGTLQEALEDALDRSSAKETQLQGSQHAALQLLERIKEVRCSTNSRIKLIYPFLIARRGSNRHRRKLHDQA